MVRYANINDRNFLKLDHHIDMQTLEKKILANEILVFEKSKKLIGWLRFNYFWDSIPFMNMLFVEEQYRRNGYGKQLVSFWENEMYKNNNKKIMTSTQSDENAQHFYRALGYVEIGSIIIPDEPLEIIFMKDVEKSQNDV